MIEGRLQNYFSRPLGLLIFKNHTIRARIFHYFHTYHRTKTNDLYKYLLYVLRRISFFFFSLLFFFFFSLFCTTNKQEDPFILRSFTSYKYNNTDVFCTIYVTRFVKTTNKQIINLLRIESA